MCVHAYIYVCMHVWVWFACHVSCASQIQDQLPNLKTVILYSKDVPNSSTSLTDVSILRYPRTI